MTKLFFESDTLLEEWFMELPLQYRYLWIILNLLCNKGGIIDQNSRLLNFWVGYEVDIISLKKHFEKRITVFGNKIFINDFFAIQNGYNLNISNDAVRGRLKTFFEHKELNECLLRKIGYRFFSGPKDNLVEITNVVEFLIQYPKAVKDEKIIDMKFLLGKNNIEINSSTPAKAIGKPGNSNSNVSKNSVGNRTIKGYSLSFELYQKELHNYPNVKNIKKQLTEEEFQELINLDVPKKIDSKVFWSACEELENKTKPIISDSVFQSLSDIFLIPF